MASIFGAFGFKRLVGLNAPTQTPNAAPLISIGNSRAPQIANYALVIGAGFFAASLVDGSVRTAGAAEYIHGTHAAAIYSAEAQKSSVWKSVRTPPAVAAVGVPVFVSGSRAETQGESAVWKSLRTPPAAPSGILAQFLSAPEQQGFNLAASTFSSSATAISADSRVAPQVLSFQDADTFTPSFVWASVRQTVTATAVPGLVNAVAQQFEQTPSKIWASTRAGQTPPVIVTMLGGPQFVDLTQQGFIVESATTPPVVSYALRTMYSAPQQVDLTQQAAISESAASIQGAVPRPVLITQDDTSQVSAQVFKSVATPPAAFTGMQPAVVLSGMPQVDPTQPPASFTQPIVFGIAPPIPPVVQPESSGGWWPTTPKRKRYVIREEEKEQRELLEQIAIEYAISEAQKTKAKKAIRAGQVTLNQIVGKRAYEKMDVSRRIELEAKIQAIQHRKRLLQEDDEMMMWGY